METEQARRRVRSLAARSAWALLLVLCYSSSESGNRTDTRASAGASAVLATGDTDAVKVKRTNGGRDAGQASGPGAGSHGGSEPQRPPPTRVAGCDGLAPEGTFEEITPPEVKAGIGTKTAGGQTRGGTFAIAVDPVNKGTIYAGTLLQKLWKSTDCGATWKVSATGTNAANVNSGMNWTLAVDPVDPNIVYTNSGYGANSLFKSMDGGVNWADVWSGKSQPVLGKSFANNFVNVVAIDPGNHQHVLLTFHESCLPPHHGACIAETLNGGSTWRLIEGETSWSANEGQVIFFLNDSDTWLWGSQNSGFWRSGDSGKSWERIQGMTTSHLQGSQLVRSVDGAFFAAGADGIWRSPDGRASTWRLVPNTGPIVGGLVSDGTTLFASTCYSGRFCNPRYLRSPEVNGRNWTVLISPVMSQGGTFAYDKAYRILYSSNLEAGMWRVVVR